MAGLRDVASLIQIESKNIVWHAKDKAVVINANGKEIKLVIGQKTAIVNGEKVALDVPAQIKDGRTVLPVAYIARLLGLDVDYDSVTKEVIFTLKNN